MGDIMEYRYRKHQIFKKKLDVPSFILNSVYKDTLTIKEMVEYDLIDKIPMTCLKEEERELAEKFGIEKFRDFDWDLLRVYISINSGIKKPMEYLKELDSSTEDLSLAIYEYLKDKIDLSNYTDRMKQVYKNRFFTEEEFKDGELEHIESMKRKFNNGYLSLSEMIYYLSLLEDKDLSYCLLRDKENTENITQEQLRDVMSNNSDLFFVLKSTGLKIVEAISLIASKDQQKIEDIIKEKYEEILFDEHKLIDFQDTRRLENKHYKLIFKYFSLEKFLRAHNSYPSKELIEELNSNPNLIFDTKIPFVTFCNYYAISFVSKYGLQNVIEFDNECGNFFAKNDGQMLKIFDDMYLHYDHSGEFAIKPWDQERLYTKDEFYLAMRKMIVHGPTNWDYSGQAPDYRKMTGEFLVRNADLFMADNAPEELKQKFYTKSLDPKDIMEHPEYIEFLKGKDLSSCFKLRQISVVKNKEDMFGSYYENLYKYLLKNYGFDKTIKTITEYYEPLERFYDYENNGYRHDYHYTFKFLENGSFEDLKETLDSFTRHIILKEQQPYPKIIPDSLKNAYPEMFLSDDAPQELKDTFYQRTIDATFLKNNPQYREYLIGKSPEIFFKNIIIGYNDTEFKRRMTAPQTNFSNFIIERFGYEAFFKLIDDNYGKVLEELQKAKSTGKLVIDDTTSLEGVYTSIDKKLYRTILRGYIKYDLSVPEHFQSQYPQLFLDSNTPGEIQNKFYNREFTLEDFKQDESLLQYFENTNIACGLPTQYAWLINLFDKQNIMESNINRLKILDAYIKINDTMLQETFKNFVTTNYNKLDYRNLDYVAQVLYRLSYSNSAEIYNFRNELATQILATKEPLESLERIEEIFLKNNLPTVGKIFSTYEILHPNFAGFESSNNSKMSPTLKHKSIKGKQITLFSDLLKAAFASNNKSVKKYLDNIERGYAIYLELINNKTTYEEFSELDKQEFITFRNHLITLYNNTYKGKKSETDLEPTENILQDVNNLAKLFAPNGNMNYNLADRVISMYCHFAGFDTLEEAKKYFVESVRQADIRNRERAQSPMVLEEGDFIKGIGDIKYLKTILQNGSVSKEFLGASASSDATPLDTDLSRITKVSETTEATINGTAATSYGSIMFVLKNDDRFVTTRTKGGPETPQADKLTKLEVFHTGVCDTATSDHYGIRTGFASSVIDYIISEDKRVGLEIALNGFYIPVVNQKGEVIFTPQDYDIIREKMSGLSHYNSGEYIFSTNLETPGVSELQSQILESNKQTEVKRAIINAHVKETLMELGLTLKTQMDGDISQGTVELIDTGSTGRGTNKPFEGDFDFMMRLDKSILNDSNALNKIKAALLKGFGRTNQEGIIGSGDFRLKNVELDGVTVDIDITFTEKTDKISYSTDMALQDRLETIKKQSPEKYSYVVANILLAKQILKEAGVYKPNRGETPQGGLGGVGIENWILQHGGSFIDACTTFLKASKGRTFEDFKKIYVIWDFGENHLAERRGHYIHDNFVSGNMTEEGYLKMQKAILTYLKTKNLINEEDNDFDDDGGMKV